MLSVEATVIVPWDFSEHAKCGLGFALEAATHDNIHVICVLERPDPYSQGAIWGDEAEERAIEKCIEQFWGIVNKSRFPELQLIVRFGDPAAEIVHYAETIQAATIVISTHGRSGIKRLMLGSVAQKVSQTASCPVMLLPNAWFEAVKQQPTSESVFRISTLS
jgi:nucleotide-binding universal stress UspA family protein